MSDTADDRMSSVIGTNEADRIREALIAGQNETDELQAPPASVWAGIQADLGSTDVASSAPQEHLDVGATRVIDLGQERTRRRGASLLGAAAVSLLLVGSAFAIVRATTAGSDVITQAALDPLDGQVATGEVSVVETDDGFELDLEFDGVETGSGYLELWVIDENVDAMVSLGPVRGNGRYLVPAGVELATYPIVDLSIEQPDGDPTHGGKSVLRGVLDV